MNKWICLFASLLVFIACFVLWDFLQIGRRPPQLATIEEQATHVEIDKTARQLKLLRGSEVIKIYNIALGSAPVGHKSQEGDGHTPEGSYSIESKNDRSHFHLALRISYPNTNDRDVARQRGVSPGGDIMIHGLPNGLGWLGLHLKRDWTNGCIAVTNREIDEIWRLVATGTPITILP